MPCFLLEAGRLPDHYFMGRTDQQLALSLEVMTRRTSTILAQLKAAEDIRARGDIPQPRRGPSPSRGTQNPEPRAQNPEPRTQNPEPRTQNLEAGQPSTQRKMHFKRIVTMHFKCIVTIHFLF